MAEDFNIKFEHVLKAIETPVDRRDLIHAYINEPLINLKTGERYNVKEVFRSAYYYANKGKMWGADEKGKLKPHNKIAKRIIKKIIEPHKEWVVRKES